MPNLPGRYQYSMEHQREPLEKAGIAAPPSKVGQCSGCGTPVPEGQKCIPCADEAVSLWVASKKAAKASTKRKKRV